MAYTKDTIDQYDRQRDANNHLAQDRTRQHGAIYGGAKALDTRGLEAIYKGLNLIKAATGDPRVSEFCDKCWELAQEMFATL